VRRALLAGTAVLLLAAPASAFDSAREATNLAKSQERFVSYATDPGYQAQMALQALSQTKSLAAYLARHPGASPVNPCADAAGPCAGDTRVFAWKHGVGVVRPIHFANRNGATISGHLWARLPPGPSVTRLPAVLIVNGDLASEEIYWWAAAVLARHGYLVMTYDPQGHGRSDTFGSGADVLRHVDIQQAAGCDCVEPQANADAADQARDALDFLFSSPATPYTPRRPTGAETQRAGVADGEKDASNPLAALLDPEHVGLAGHSRGAFAVSILGSRDRRVKAIAAWDDLLAGDDPEELAAPVVPRVPAMGLSADYYEAPQPYTEHPDPFAKSRAFDAYRRAGIDVMELAIRGGTHYEASYVPNPGFPATLRGIDLVSWYTQAFFDRYLRRDASAVARLLSDRWRADGAGARVDPAGDGNLFSFYYRSQVAIHDGAALVTCASLRAGCPALVPRARDGYRGRYSYLRAAGL
jgi:pimeloyl-ACP methyl ester carboxylesterase